MAHNAEAGQGPTGGLPRGVQDRYSRWTQSKSNPMGSAGGTAIPRTGKLPMTHQRRHRVKRVK